MRAIALVGVVACTTTPPPCDIVRLPDGSTVRHTIAIETDTAIAMSAHGPAVACAACGEITRFDADATMQSNPLAGGVTVIASDAADGYYVAACTSDFDDSPALVRGLAADGSERWHREIPTCVRSIVVGPEGPYAVHGVNGSSDVTALGPDDGIVRWTRHVQVGSNVSARTGGGIVLTSSGTLTFVDAAGSDVATRTLTTTNDNNFNSVDVFALVPVDDGVAVFGEVTGSRLDLGDVQVDTSAAHSFFAVLDETSTKWVTLVTEDEVEYFAVHNDQLIIAGPRRPVGARAGSYIGVYTQTGLDHTIEISGPAEEAVTALAAGADGSIWATVVAVDRPDELGNLVGASGLTIADVTDTNPGDRDVTYLVNLL